MSLSLPLPFDELSLETAILSSNASVSSSGELASAFSSSRLVGRIADCDMGPPGPIPFSHFDLRDRDPERPWLSSSFCRPKKLLGYPGGGSRPGPVSPESPAFSSKEDSENRRDICDFDRD